MVSAGVTHKFASGPTKDHFFEIIIYMYMYKANDPSYTCKQRNIFGKNNIPSEELAITNTKGNSMNT
jgi:hypothetical protein